MLALLLCCSCAAIADDLPRPGEVLTREQVVAMADRQGWVELAERIRVSPPPARYFCSDGCSGGSPQVWRGVSLYRYCLEHDAEYWLGGSPLDRLRADARLMLLVAEATGDVDWAVMMFNGVRHGGDLPGAPWRWGKVGVRR